MEAGLMKEFFINYKPDSSGCPEPNQRDLVVQDLVDGT